MVTNATIEALLGRRSIRKFKDEAIDDDTRATLETVAQHAASSQFLNDWSAIRIIDPAIKAKLAEFGHQPYIATAPLLYVFVIDEHCDDSVPTPQHFITGYRQNCTTIPPVSHHQQTFTYQSHYADNQRPVLQENPPNQQYSHQWWE